MILKGGENPLEKMIIEYLHKAGKMPDRYYYQQNGKSGFENYIEQILKRPEYQAYLENELQAEVEKQLPKALENALDEVLKGFDG